jgi:hypothetical protein
LVAAKKDGENIILRFAASNGHSYSLILCPTCAGQSVQDFTGLPETDEIATLTPTRAWTLGRPDNRQGIAVHTREGGTISIELAEGTISASGPRRAAPARRARLGATAAIGPASPRYGLRPDLGQRPGGAVDRVLARSLTLAIEASAAA